MFRYKPKGVCSKSIEFEIEDDKITKCEFRGGCQGNLSGIARLIIGRRMDEVIDMLKGIECQGNTSCPDQLALALEQYKSGK